MNRMKSNRLNTRYLVIPLTLLFFSGCVYFNTFYMAKKKFNEAEKSQRQNAEKQQEQEIGQKGKSGRSSGQIPERPVPRGRGQQPGQPAPGGKVISKANAQERSLYDDAIKKASKVLIYHPNSKWADDALWLIGKANFNLGDYSAADRKFKELVTNHPNSKFADDAYYYMGLSQIELNNDNLASEMFERIEKEFKKSEYFDEIYFARGRIAVLNENYSEAVELFGRYLEKYSKEDSAAMAAFTMGLCNEELGDYHSAYKNYKSVEKYDPPRKLRFEAAMASGSVMLKTDSTAVGMKILDDLVGDERYFSETARIRLKIAEGYHLQNEFERSVAEYTTITEQNPKTAESAEAFYRLGLIYQNKLFDIEKAKESFGKVQSEFSASEFRNLALARSAQIAKFETYQTQLQKADSVRVARESAQDDSIQTSDSLLISRPDSTSLDSLLVENSNEENKITLPDTIEIVPEPDSMIAEDTLFVDDPGNEEKSRLSFPDSSGTITEPDSVVSRVAEEIYTVNDSGFVESDSSVSSDTSSVARADSVKIQIIDEQAVIDSINAAIATRKAKEDSLRQAIIEEGIRIRFLLGELYAYELSQPDSAINEYMLIVEQHPTSNFASKSLLAAASLRLNDGDSISAREYLQRLLDDYPQTPQAASAAKIMEYPLDLSGNAIGLYAYAESLLFEANDPDSAAVVFEYVAYNFPDLAPQASFARARALELASDGADSSAYFAYQAVSDNYPQSVYAETARERMGQSSNRGAKRPPRRENKKEENRREDKPDTTGAFAGVMPPAPPVKLEGEFVYPQALLDRRLKGEVLFKIKINLFGKVEEHEIIGPSGEYAIDSSATAALLETEFDTSDYDLARLDAYFRYGIPFERPDINIFNDPYREENKDPY